MAVAEPQAEPEPGEQPVSTKTRVILKAIERLDLKLNDLQDVSEAIREIRQTLGVNNNWHSSIIRALKHFVSLIEPNGHNHKK